MLCCFIPATIWFNPSVPSENTEQRKLAAIMFTDMVGYSTLSQRDEKLAQELLEEHRQLLREIFLAFTALRSKPSATHSLSSSAALWKAAQCAIEIQRARQVQ